MWRRSRQPREAAAAAAADSERVDDKDHDEELLWNPYYGTVVSSS